MHVHQSSNSQKVIELLPLLNQMEEKMFPLLLTLAHNPRITFYNLIQN